MFGKLSVEGHLPELYRNPELDWEMFYTAYVSTFIQRDIRQLTAIQDLNVSVTDDEGDDSQLTNLKIRLHQTIK